MSYRARYTPEAAARVRRLHPQVKKRIRAAVDHLSKSPLDGHALHDELAGLRSLRVVNYRIIYRLNEEGSVLEIVLVGPRRDIYEELRERVLRDATGGM